MRGKLIISILVLLFLYGCTTQKKATRWMKEHPVVLAKLCAECFPVKPIEFIKGDTLVLLDSVVRVDSVRVEIEADCPDGSKVKVDCPPTRIVERVVKSHTTDTLKLRDTANETVLQNELNKAKKWENYFYYSLVGIALLLVLLLLRRSV